MSGRNYDEPGRYLYSERRHRSHFAGPGRFRRTWQALVGSGRPPHWPAALLSAPVARTAGAIALAPPPRPRLRVGDATSGVGISRGASGPATQRRAVIPA